MITGPCLFRVEVQRWNVSYDKLKAEMFYEDTEQSARQQAAKHADRPRVDHCIIFHRDTGESPWREIARIEGH